MSVGLLVVRLLYLFYVFGHLSKWFTFFSFLVVCLLLSGSPLHLLPTSLYPLLYSAYTSKKGRYAPNCSVLLKYKYIFIRIKTAAYWLLSFPDTLLDLQP